MNLTTDKVYFFGDSLSDTGNVFNFTGGSFPAPPLPYAPGRFSNGDVWADYFNEEFGLTVDPFIAGFNPVPVPEIVFNLSDINDGTDFAVGGADSGYGNVGIVPLGLQQQIDAFELLAQNQSAAETFDDDLFFVWAGSNDYLNFLEDADNPATPYVIELEANFPQKPKDLVKNVVDNNIGGAIQEIIDAGGENIVVFNLPDLDITPLAQGLDNEARSKLRDLTEDHNKSLKKLEKKLEKSNTDVNLIEIDVNNLFDQIIANPSNFGFTNVTNNFSGVDLYTGKFIPPSTGNINEYLFVDSVHLSTRAHELIADLVTNTLTSEGVIV